MFPRLTTAFLYVFVAFTVLATASPAVQPRNEPTVTITVTAHPTATSIPASQCNTGGLQCCNSVQNASSDPVSLLLGLLGVVLQGLNIQVGLTCSPITVIGGGGSSCTAQPVCCQNNSFHGLIAIGCTPININL
ncbi:Fruiting body protein SC3 [Hypsizygus marmoreus]|uniref:Hydrophobin n=1 Tax=Hypsizygus marmoreus TaxID=39966 RepID=A0A369JKV4_HYPMA|nr:Fruiting body protein SC3 [Hypsizygus marmoreus]